MNLRRREFLFGSAVMGLAGAGGIRTAKAASHPKIKAVAFDAFPVFDPRPIFALVEKMFPGRGSELSNLWRTRQFEYTWLRTLTGEYADFWKVTQDALQFSASALKIEISSDQMHQLMEQYLKLNVWPDALPALQMLKNAGLKIGFLSNFTPTMLDACIQHSGLQTTFDFVLSTDLAKTFKPAPQAYQLGIDQLNLKKEEILFVAFAGWDAAGAKLFGYPTYWVNRLGMPAEVLGATADFTASNLSDLPTFLR